MEQYICKRGLVPKVNQYFLCPNYLWVGVITGVYETHIEAVVVHKDGERLNHIRLKHDLTNNSTTQYGQARHNYDSYDTACAEGIKQFIEDVKACNTAEEMLFLVKLKKLT